MTTTLDLPLFFRLKRALQNNRMKEREGKKPQIKSFVYNLWLPYNNDFSVLKLLFSEITIEVATYTVFTITASTTQMAQWGTT